MVAAPVCVMGTVGEIMAVGAVACASGRMLAVRESWTYLEEGDCCEDGVALGRTVAVNGVTVEISYPGVTSGFLFAPGVTAWIRDDF